VSGKVTRAACLHLPAPVLVPVRRLWQKQLTAAWVLGVCRGTDPCLYFDARGNWHVLFHVYTKVNDFHVQRYSGHGFSTDVRAPFCFECALAVVANTHASATQGLRWRYSETEPFNGTVRFTDGTATTYATRERPHVVFDRSDLASTRPVAVITAVSSQQIGPSCATCHEGACSQCKITLGRDWTYTVLQPLVGWKAE
jgi:hypothetical protein